MRHKDERFNHLDSAGMPFPARKGSRRGLLPALLACLALAPLLAGCGEDRSNLIPRDTSDSLIGHFDRIQSLAASGECFEAAKVARTAQQEIEAMGTKVDPELKRSLLDGVTDLTLLVNDPDKCTEVDTTSEEPTVTEETPTEEGTTGETGTTDTNQDTTGEQGTTDENQDSNQTDTNADGNQNQTTPPAANPTTPATPTNPGGGVGPGSGGLGPG